MCKIELCKLLKPSSSTFCVRVCLCVCLGVPGFVSDNEETTDKNIKFLFFFCMYNLGGDTNIKLVNALISPGISKTLSKE